MSEISDLEKRMTNALDRMRAAHQTTQSALRAARAQVAALEDELAALPQTSPDELSRVETLEQEAERNRAELDAARQTVTTLTTELEQERGEVKALMEALATEKDAVASLAEQGAAGEASLARLEEEMLALRAGGQLSSVKTGGATESLQARITTLERTVQSLQAANGQLRQNNAILRKAQEDGLSDADLVNDGMKAEIEALSAARDADRAEIDSVLAALQQLLEEKADA